MTSSREYWHTQQAARIAELEAELAAMRPWAEMGRRAVRERWFDLEDGLSSYLCCSDSPPTTHVITCPIPSLLAQLEADANGR